MNNNYTNNEIIDAVNTLLENNKEAEKEKKNELLLPKDTELIILQAEKFLNK